MKKLKTEPKVRKPISKRTRFEVFKRDSFKCQYCGESAPKVILHIDHIQPVAKGGDNHITNLITSCDGCNLGKSDKLISDNTAIEKSKAQLDLLQEKREQLELMQKWRTELKKFEDKIDSEVIKYFNAKSYPFSLNETGISKLRKVIKKHDLKLVYDSIDVSFDRYLGYEDGKPIQSTVSYVLDKIGGIAYFKSLPPLDQKKNWVSLALSRYFNKEKWQVNELVNVYCNTIGFLPDEEVIDDLQNEFYPRAKNFYSYSQLKAYVYDLC